MSSRPDVWDYVTRTHKFKGGYTWQCNYCDNTFVSSRTRAKAHLLHDEKKGIAICTKVPPETQTLLRGGEGRKSGRNVDKAAQSEIESLKAQLATLNNQMVQKNVKTNLVGGGNNQGAISTILVERSNLQGAYAATSMEDHNHSVESQPSMEEEDCSSSKDVGADSILKEPVVMDIADTLMKESTAVYEDNHLGQEMSGSSFPEAAHGNKATLVDWGAPSALTQLTSSHSNQDLPASLEAKFKDFVTCFETSGCSSVTIDNIVKPLSGEQSLFGGCEIPSEFVSPLTKFAHKYGGGSLSTLFVKGKSPRQRQVLTKQLGQLLYSMETEELRSLDTILIWRDACHDMVDWGLEVGFICDHLKAVARSYLGFVAKPAGLEDCYREVQKLEQSVFELRNQLAHLEGQLEKAQQNLHAKFGGAISPESMSLMLESSWTPQSHAADDL